MEYFLHRFSFCDIIHELVEIADISHEFIFYFLYLVSADTAGDESTVRIRLWCFSEKSLEISLFFENSCKSHGIIAREPVDDLIDFGFLSSFFLDFRDIELIDTREGHMIDTSVGWYWILTRQAKFLLL